MGEYSLGNYTYKFNHNWISNEEFQKLVQESWYSFVDYEGESAMFAMTDKLIKLKKVVRRWIRDQNRVRVAELLSIEGDIIDVFDHNASGNFSRAELDLLTTLEGRKLQILRHEEEEWRLKGWALWIDCGNLNTIFFHRFTNQRRITNSIWDLEDDMGQIISSHKDLSVVAMKHFKYVFIDPWIPRLEAQLKILPLFPHFLFDEDNRVLGRAITLEEIENILKACAK